MRRNAQLILSGVTSAATLLVSGWQPFERATWLLEIFPVLIALPVIAITRNPYDKVGHFMQGFVPALVAREIFMRGGYVTGRKMTAFLCICVVMAVSAWYELIEWAAAVAFLGTQGDPWDTQSDMLFAFIGGSVALLLMPRIHDRQMARLMPAR